MALPVSFLTQTKSDNTLKANGDAETTSWRLPVTTINAGNFTAQATKLTTLDGAIAAITLGRTIRTATLVNVFEQAATPASDPLAQRENKWLARYHDATNGQKFQVSWGTADLSLHMANSEFLDLSTGAGAALKTAFEDVVVSPNDSSHTVVLDSVQFVGRNS